MKRCSQWGQLRYKESYEVNGLEKFVVTINVSQEGSDTKLIKLKDDVNKELKFYNGIRRMKRLNKTIDRVLYSIYINTLNWIWT